VKSLASQHDAAAPQSSEHSDVTILHFSKAPIPLSSHPNGLRAFLGNGAFVNDQKTVLRASKRCVYIAGNSIQNLSMAPGRLRNEMLVGLLVDFRHHFGHTLHVSLLRLKQAEQDLPGLFNYVARSAGEKVAEPYVKSKQLIRSAPKGLLVPTTFLWYRHSATTVGTSGYLYFGPQAIHAPVQFTNRSTLFRTFCGTA
jgi:hypothetical protein